MVDWSVNRTGMIRCKATRQLTSRHFLGLIEGVRNWADASSQGPDLIQSGKEPQQTRPKLRLERI
jgi:hypothetical protein